MTARSRFLGGVTSPPPPPPSKDSSAEQQSVEPPLDSDFVVILAALLCALICVLGLVTVARCTWLRRITGGTTTTTTNPSSSAANKGLKKKVLKSLPKLTYGGELDKEQADKLSSDCAICLAEFAAGEEIRVLPQCGHGFHVICIDTWLGSHSSCPSCRQLLLVAPCKKCGELPPATPSTSSSAATDHNHVDRFLP